MLNITARMVQTALFRALAERGHDHIDPRAEAGDGCIYALGEGDEFPALEPSCIVGFVFAQFGLLGLISDCAGAWRDVRDIFDGKAFTVADDADVMLTAAQSRQDSAGTWGDAVQDAIEARVSHERRALEHQSSVNQNLTEDLSAAKAEIQSLKARIPVDAADHEALVEWVYKDAAALSLIASTRKIDAIKRVRKFTGAGLKAAKEAVEDSRVVSYAEFNGYYVSGPEVGYWTYLTDLDAHNTPVAEWEWSLLNTVPTEDLRF